MRLPATTLTYRDDDLSATRTPASGPNGQVTDTGLKPVLFTGMEQFWLGVPGVPAPPVQQQQQQQQTPQGDQPPARDGQKPTAGSLRLSSSRIARRGRRPRPIPRLSFTLDEAAAVQVVVERRLTGRRVGSRCSTTARTGRRCTIFREQFASRIFAGKAGANRLTLPQAIRSLPRGTYRITLTATDAAGNVSDPKRVTLRIIR